MGVVLDDERYMPVTTLSSLLFHKQGDLHAERGEKENEITSLPTILSAIALCACLLISVGAEWESWLDNA